MAKVKRSLSRKIKRFLIKALGKKGTKSAFGVLSEAAKGSINITVKLVGEGFDKFIEVNHAVSTISREMGLTFNQMKGQQENIISNYGKMANRLGMTFEEIFKFQQQYTDNIGKSVVLTNTQVESMASLSKVMGDTAVNEMVANMDAFGASSSSAIDYLTLGMARASNQGLNIKKASEAFANNIKMSSQYTFKKGVDGISKMTMLSQRLKFNMESIGSAMDKFSTIEGAIGTSANLQMLGGSYAANFSNPMQAMGEALLDAEGFTQRIVNTVAQTAVFNNQSGMVEMSALDKAKMKEAANQLGISYDEMWNMASQQAKMSNIRNATRGLGFDEEQLTFLANTAQYDAADKTWKISRYNEETNEQEEVDVRTLSKEDFKQIQKDNNFEKSVQDDVHQIRAQLTEYLQKETKDYKSYKEAFTGAKERVKFGFAQPFQSIDPKLTNAKDSFHEAKTMIPALSVMVGWNVLKWLGGKTVGSIGSGRISGGLRGARRGMNSINGALTRKFGANAIRLAKVGSGALAVGYGIGEGVVAQVKHKRRRTEILNDETTSKEEKEALIIESKKERNKGIGKGVGAAVGGVIGQILIPTPGVGAAVGGAVGSWVGGAIGKSVKPKGFNNVDIANTTSNTLVAKAAKKENISVSESQPIKTEVKQKPQSEKSTYIRSENITVSSTNGIDKLAVNDIKLDISGALKVTSDGGKNIDLDMNKLLDTPQFKAYLRDAISESLSRNISPTQTRNLNSYQSRTGGQWTMNSSNGRA